MARPRARALETGAGQLAQARGSDRLVEERSANRTALELLRSRQLIETKSEHTTATPEHRVLRHWHSR